MTTVQQVSAEILNEERVEELIGGLSFMPGWAIDMDWEHSLDEQSFAVLITKVVSDADSPDKTATSVFRIHMPLSWSDDQIKMHIFSGFENMLLHEVREWFRYNGEPVVNPHPEEAMRKDANSRWFQVVIGNNGQCERGWLHSEEFPDGVPLTSLQG